MNVPLYLTMLKYRMHISLNLTQPQAKALKLKVAYVGNRHGACAVPADFPN